MIPLITREDAHEAIRTLLRYMGEDPERDGLKNTPERVIRAYDAYVQDHDPKTHLNVTFEEDYSEIVLLRDIPFSSLCEHHLAPIVGVAHVAYQPRGRVVGLSKLARLVEGYAKRLQLQERLTRQIAQALQETLDPLGVFVMIHATHHCMTTRGVNKPGAIMATSYSLGCLKDHPRFLNFS